MSKRKAKKQADTLPDGFPPMLVPRRAKGDDAQFWGQTILNQYGRIALSPPEFDTSAHVSIFRTLNRMKRFRRFRALCEAVGLGPCEEFGEGENGAAKWWLQILLMPQEFHDDLWRSFPKYLLALRTGIVEVATAAAKEDRRKKAIIISQAEQIADFRKQVKAAINRRRPPFEKKTRPLTDRQIETMQILGECRGNYAEAGRRLRLDPKTVRQHDKAAKKKLAEVGVRPAPASKLKPTTKTLPEDHRGQTDVYRDANGEVRRGRDIDRRRRSGKRHDQG